MQDYLGHRDPKHTGSGDSFHAMNCTGQPMPIRIGDIVYLIEKPTRFIVREILPDGKYAVCERIVSAGPETFFAGSGISHASYNLALKDLEKR